MKKDYAVQPVVVWTAERDQAYMDGTDSAFAIVQRWFKERTKRTFTLLPAKEFIYPENTRHYFADILVRLPDVCNERRIFYLVVSGVSSGGAYSGRVAGCDFEVPGRACIDAGAAAVLAGYDPVEKGYPTQPWFHDELDEVYGSLAHEIGHCIGLPHTLLPSLMSSRWPAFPDIPILPEQMKIIRKSPFFRGR